MELVQLETLRIHFADTTKMVTRKVVIRQQQTDTAASASLQLRSSQGAEKTKTAHQPPLTGQSKKKGLAGLRPKVVYSCIVIFTIFFFILYKMKKK